MTVRDIVSHVQALYGIELSPASVSNITDKIMEEAREWYSRTLDGFYPVVFLDAVHYKVREEGRIVTKHPMSLWGSTRKAEKTSWGSGLVKMKVPNSG